MHTQQESPLRQDSLASLILEQHAPPNKLPLPQDQATDAQRYKAICTKLYANYYANLCPSLKLAIFLNSPAFKFVRETDLGSPKCVASLSKDARVLLKKHFTEAELELKENSPIYFLIELLERLEQSMKDWHKEIGYKQEYFTMQQS